MAYNTLQFSNSNGVTFGTSTSPAGNIVTATVATNYQPAGAYLTTAMASNQSSAFAGINGAITGGSITLNTSGVSINLPAYLTTAQPVGAYLTTAALSQDSSKYAGINGAITGGSITLNTSGVSINLPAYLTTAQPVGAYLTTAMASNRGSDFLNVSGGFSGTNISGTLASNGLQLSVAAGGGGADGYNIIAAGGSTANSTGTIVFSNSNGVSFGLNGATVTATVATNYQSQGAYLTTARASTDGIGLNSALTANGVSMTANSSGLSLNFPAFLTTAMQSQSSSVFAKTGFTSTTTAGTAVVGTLNTNGLSIGVPAFLTTAQPVGAYLTTAMQTGSQSQLWVMGNSSATIGGTNISGTMYSNGMSLSAAAPGGGGAIAVYGGTASGNLQTLSFDNAGGVSFGLNGSTITASAAGGGGALPLYLSYQNRQLGASGSTQFTNAQLWMIPFIVAGGSISASTLQYMQSLGGTYTSAVAATHAETMNWAIYSNNSTNLTRLDTWQSGQLTWQVWNSGTSSGSWAMNGSTSSSAGTGIFTQISGVRMINIPLATTIGTGLYVMAFNQSTSSAGYSGLISRYGFVVDNPMPLGIGLRFGSAAATSIGYGDAGTYSALSTNAFPSSIGLSNIRQHSNIVPYFKIGGI